MEDHAHSAEWIFKFYVEFIAAAINLHARPKSGNIPEHLWSREGFPVKGCFGSILFGTLQVWDPCLGQS